MSAVDSVPAVAAHRIALLNFVTAFAIGGTERQVMNMVQGLDASKFEVHLACLQRFGALLGELDARRLPVREYPIRRLWGPRTIGRQLRLARDLRRNRIEIVHTYNFYSNVFAVPAARAAGTPVVVASIRDIGAYLTSRQRHVQRLVCRLADQVLVNAEAIKDWLVSDGYDSAKISVIRNGIDLSRFAPSGVGALRGELGLPPGAPVVALLSRLNRLKGVEDFLEAASAVAARFPNARFLIVGDSASGKGADYRRELEGRAVDLGLQGRIVFTGFRLDVPALLSQVTVSVLPSYSEGLSNTLLESMAAGVPVVATRVGGNPEAVVDGVTGLLVLPRQPTALADAIVRLLGDRSLAHRLGEQGRERVARCFSIDRMVRETERVYFSLLQRSARRQTQRAAY